MPRLFVFNPDTDYCLVSGADSYTPPANVVEVRRSLAMTPLAFASPGDALLVLDDIDPPTWRGYEAQASLAGVELLTPSLARAERRRLQAYVAVPWGWNASIRRTLTSVIGDMQGMPSAESIEEIRRLSHRRSNIEMLRAMAPRLDKGIEMPAELSESAEALLRLEREGQLWFKAPWSSSGRGVILASTDDDMHKTELWIQGIIRRQGSVMVEKAYDRVFDFATEWFCRHGKARFLGYSVFDVSFRGKYQSNVSAPQTELLAAIKKRCAGWEDGYLQLQRQAIETVFAANYEGPLGVDMLATRSGAVNPSVEVNLRHTMGMPGLLKYKDL